VRMRTPVAAGLWACLGLAVVVSAARAQVAAPSVTVSSAGALVYQSDARGNTVVDFSHAGYGGGGVAIPDVPIRVVVGPGPGDDGLRIQRAIDIVSALPLDASGLRGTVLLLPGRYEVAGALRIAASGVVVRGSGREGPSATTVVAEGTSRRTLFVLAGSGTPVERPRSRRRVVDAYVPVGAYAVTLDDAAGLRVGDRLMVHRPSTKAWISSLGMDTFPGWRPENRLHWQEGSRDVTWDRTVVAVQGARVEFDAPLTTSLDPQFGSGHVYAYDFGGRIAHVGLEYVRLESAWDRSRPLDEDHAWNAVEVDAAEHAWVRQVSATHFAGAAVQVGAFAAHVTIEDVDAADPVSEVGGFRRRVFLNLGQLTLFQRCTSRQGKHDFVAGFTAAGPNVFRDSTSHEAHDYSGPLESWASGVLYDNVVVRGNALRLINRGTADQGAGWAAANSVLWNCEATDIEVQHPPGAFNQAYGCKGTTAGDGIVADARAVPFRDFFRGMAVPPRSLYEAQLRARLGEPAIAALAPRHIEVSHDAALVMDTSGVATATSGTAAIASQTLAVRDGQFAIGDAQAWTSARGYSWFQAQIPPALAPAFGHAVTRFVPGRYGRGLTDDLDDVVASLEPGTVFVQHYGLWYDRRRVDHNYDGSAERRTGDVWAPFMELPWARSGQGKAWDGLSRFDLTRFNPWYFDRVAAFADLVERRGRVMHYAFYFQHWVLESRAHYVDFPWRPVNALQATDLPDEVPAASTFYDIAHPVRRDLHRRYIRHTLDILGNKRNVVFGIDREYTGPLSFVEFWLDTMAEWQREHGRRVFISLEIPKAQVDAILDDPVRGPLVTALGVHHWVYRPDGTLFAIRGGIDKAPREQVDGIVTPAERAALGITDPAFAGDGIVNAPAFQQRQRASWASSPAMKYRAYREYRDRSATLVLLGQRDPRPDLSRALEAAVPAEVRARFRPLDSLRSDRASSWVSGAPGEGYLAYSLEGRALVIDLADDRGSYEVSWIDGETGMAHDTPRRVNGGRVVTLNPPRAGRAWVAWLRRPGRSGR
jgi:hypothetical protein